MNLCEPLGGTEGLIETVGFKKMTESMWWRTSANACRELRVSSILSGQSHSDNNNAPLEIIDVVDYGRHARVDFGEFINERLVGLSDLILPFQLIIGRDDAITMKSVNTAISQ